MLLVPLAQSLHEVLMVVASVMQKRPQHLQQATRAPWVLS
jgi:hypothetical protein